MTVARWRWKTERQKKVYKMARIPWIWYTSIEKKNETIVMLCKIENVVFWKYDRNIEETNE